jgi:hypothetical protein
MSAEHDDVLGAARLAVECAARLLPAPADRRRYQAEFIADLHGTPPAAQLHYAVGVLAQLPALRAALDPSRPRVAPGGETSPAMPIGRRFRCRVLRWHDWRTFRTDDGERYPACAVCHRFRTDTVSRNGFAVS